MEVIHSHVITSQPVIKSDDFYIHLHDLLMDFHVTILEDKVAL